MNIVSIYSLLTYCTIATFFLALTYPDDQMKVVQEIAKTGHSSHQNQTVSDSMEGIESDHTMEDLEYQVDTNNDVHKINVHVVA